MVCLVFITRRYQGGNAHFQENYICFVKVVKGSYSPSPLEQNGVFVLGSHRPPHLMGLYTPVLLTFTFAPQGLLTWNSTQQCKLFSAGENRACFVSSACCICLLSLCILHVGCFLLHYNSTALSLHAG